GTVYLAYAPEPGQPTMSRELTRLLREVLRGWEGPLPRLCYVTDAGDKETAYYQKVLRRLRHPRTGVRLDWVRVVDYYHASERLGVPLGSGVTEAGCKTVYTQRLKLSGMSWEKAGAQAILELRVLQLSGVWDQAYARVLTGWEEVQVEGQRPLHGKKAQNAA